MYEPHLSCMTSIILQIFLQLSTVASYQIWRTVLSRYSRTEPRTALLRIIRVKKITRLWVTRDEDAETVVSGADTNPSVYVSRVCFSHLAVYSRFFIYIYIYMFLYIFFIDILKNNACKLDI